MMQGKRLSGAIKHPITGQIILDPVLAVAVAYGHYAIRGGTLYVTWDRFLEHLRHKFSVPEYYGLTPLEANTYRKLFKESMVRADLVFRYFSLKNTRGNRAAVTEWMFERKIPKFDIGGIQLIFAGDLIRALQSSKIPDEGQDSIFWKAAIARTTTKPKGSKEGRRPRAGRKASGAS